MNEQDVLNMHDYSEQEIQDVSHLFWFLLLWKTIQILRGIFLQSVLKYFFYFLNLTNIYLDNKDVGLKCWIAVGDWVLEG